jgi:predicted transcriptional regulator of viral defense system
MARKTALNLLDRLTAAGESTFSTAEAVEILGRSPQSTVNLLGRLVDDGLIGRVSRGHYAIRPLGRLGTSAAAEDTALAVAAVFSDRPHRIAYRSALARHGLVVRPSRVIQVACPDQVRITELAERPVDVVRERSVTVAVGSISAGYGAKVSTLERALLDGARRIELIGGLGVLGDALDTASSDLDVHELRTVSRQLGAVPALRRLASLARILELDDLAQQLLGGVRVPKTPIPADPRQRGPREWEDSAAGVSWSTSALDMVRSR